MGLKQWLARNTTKPSDYAREFATGLNGSIEYLAASLIAFSGKKEDRNKAKKTSKAMFANDFEMEREGFVPFETTLGGALDLTFEGLAEEVDPEFLNSAFKETTAFLCVCSENAAHRYMKPANAEEFSSALYYFVSKNSTGRFGFRLDYRQVRREIDESLPSFRCGQVLNIQSFGKDDALGALINRILLPQNGSTQYGFLVGSKEQPLGCASAMLTAYSEIDDSLKRCAKDLRW